MDQTDQRHAQVKATEADVNGNMYRGMKDEPNNTNIYSFMYITDFGKPVSIQGQGKYGITE